jgi:hypothetical protein
MQQRYVVGLVFVLIAIACCFFKVALSQISHVRMQEHALFFAKMIYDPCIADGLQEAAKFSF